jgi:hypothetical protein
MIKNNYIEYYDNYIKIFYECVNCDIQHIIILNVNFCIDKFYNINIIVNNNEYNKFHKIYIFNINKIKENENEFMNNFEEFYYINEDIIHIISLDTLYKFIKN